MQTSVHKVIVGKAFGTEQTDVNKLKVGDIALFNQDRQLIKSEDEALKASAVYVGVVADEFDFTKEDGKVEKKKDVDYSMKIDKSGHPTVIANTNHVPVPQQVTIDFRNAKKNHIIVGHRYVVKIVYKDYDINKYQISHTYEVIAEEGVDLVEQMIKKINSHPNRRVQATMMPYDVITLTARPKSTDKDLDSLNEYDVVDMEVSFYKTIPGSLLNNDPMEVPGVVITTTVPANPGLGHWRQVRDAENRNMGYDGHVFTGAYPQIKRKLRTVPGTQYDQVLITSDNPYLSNDNQYIKTTPMTIEVYVGHDNVTKIEQSNFVKCLKAFVTGKKAPSDNQ